MIISDLFALPFLHRLTIPVVDGGKKRKDNSMEDENPTKKEISVEPYIIPNRGPYPYSKPKMYVNV